MHYAGIAAITLGDYPYAANCLARAVAAGHDESRGHHAKALLAMGEVETAQHQAMAALEIDPENDAASHVVFKLLLEHRKYAELWALCEQLREAGGWPVRMVSAMALAAQTPDQLACVHRFVDRERWLKHVRLIPDPAQLAALNTLLRQQHWTPLPRIKATNGNGRRIDKLSGLAADPLLAALFRRIEDAIDDFADDPRHRPIKTSPDHPMRMLRPEVQTISSWALAVSGDGCEDWHLHPDGWVSGVFYVEVPDMSEARLPAAGCIEFGPDPLGPAASDAAWPRHLVRPRGGDLLLFPSYMGHRTWPTGVAEDRVCIAFDVLRRGVEPAEQTISQPVARSVLGVDDRLVRRERVVATCSYDVTLALNVDSGRYMALEHDGALVWNLLAEPQTILQLTARLQDLFDADRTMILAELVDLVELMIENDLVDVERLACGRDMFTADV